MRKEEKINKTKLNKEDSKESSEVPEGKKVDFKEQPDENVSIKKSELEKLKKISAVFEEEKNRFLRISADYENAKKRLDKEKHDFLKFANETLVTNLLPVIDNFERAVKSAKESKNAESIIDGIELIKNQMFDILKEAGLKKIKAYKEKFNPNLHEAIAFTETNEITKDNVAEVLQTGYLFKDRLLRPAVVKIAKPEETSEKKE